MSSKYQLSFSGILGFQVNDKVMVYVKAGPVLRHFTYDPYLTRSFEGGRPSITDHPKRSKMVWGLEGGCGVSYSLSEKVMIGADVTMTQFSKISFGDLEDDNVFFVPSIHTRQITGRVYIKYFL